MKKLLIFFFILISYPAFANISENVTGTVQSTSTSNPSFAFTTNAGSNTILIVQISGECATVASAVTYNSVSMTKAIEKNSGGDFSQIWYLVAPSTGSNTVAITQASTCREVILASAYDGVDQTNPIYNSNSQTAASQDDNITSTVNMAECGWMIQNIADSNLGSHIGEFSWITNDGTAIGTPEVFDTQNSTLTGAGYRWTNMPSGDYKARVWDNGFNLVTQSTDIVLKPSSVTTGCPIETKLRANSALKTYYVRNDGSDTAATCNGLYDADTSATPNCAFATLYGAFTNKGAPTALPGDTVIVKAGQQFEVGYNVAVHGPGCASSSPYDNECAINDIYGLFPQQLTTIEGSNFATCPHDNTQRAQLFGTERAPGLLNLDSYSTVKCLEITDHESCIDSGPDDPGENHEVCDANCTDATEFGVAAANPTCGNWAKYGLQLKIGSHDILMKDISIHGMANRCVQQIQTRGNITYDDVDMIGCGWAGLESDDGDSATDDTFLGTTSLLNSRIEWNGCGEKYPLTTPELESPKDKYNCWEQLDGGYGDGLTAGGSSGDIGTFIIDNSKIKYNTSDGVDFLHGVVGHGSVKISNSDIGSNNGQQIKVRQNLLVQNTKVDGNCDFFCAVTSPPSCTTQATYTATHKNDGTSGSFNVCRANGDILALTFAPGMTMEFDNTTVSPAHGNTTFTLSGSTCDGTENLIIRNSAFEGGTDFNGADLDDLYYCAGSDGNGAGVCCNGTTKLSDHTTIDTSYYDSSTFKTTETGFTNSSNLFSFDHSSSAFDTVQLPSTASGLIGTGNTATSLLNDFYKRYRGTTPDVGAIQLKPKGKVLKGTIYKGTN